MRMREFKLLSIVPAPDWSGERWDITIEIVEYSGMLWWKRYTVRQETYRGSGTIWRDIETGDYPERYREPSQRYLSAIAWKETQNLSQPRRN